MVFHNGSNYDYDFIIKDLAKTLKNNLLATRIDKNGEEITKNISYRLQFINSVRFVASSLSNLVNNLSEGIHKFKYKHGHHDQECDTYRDQYKYCDCFLECTIFRDELIEFKRLCCNTNYQQKFDEKLKERFFSTYKFSNQDNIKFILLLRKGVCPFEYIDDWEKFNEK